jgi:N-methylhydantoinase A/oxoprolinase/acetone carboxylase beta subunit
MMQSKPENSIDMDIGGTFTDCFVQYNGRMGYAKSPTTHYNLSTGFMRAIKEAARQLHMDPALLLTMTKMVRYSTTLAMNKLIERTGPNLGLVTTEGFEDFIHIGKGAQWTDGLSKQEARNLAQVSKPEPLVTRDRIIGIKERVNHKGEVLRNLDESDLIEKLRILTDRGVRGIVVCLLWSHVYPEHEIRVREIIEKAYPESCLGHMPVFLSHEIQPKKGEYQRAMTAILNGYLHRSVTEDLRGIRNELREKGYQGPMLMVHNSGGMGEALKTTAIDTFNGGQVAGIIGSLEIAMHYGYENVVTTDMGGTSFDLGVIYDGRAHFHEINPVIDRWMVNVNMVECQSIGAGGGSVGWINEALGGSLAVGPGSAGSMPGPACYNLGGSEPTVTDADVILGYINPDFFHGGRIQLDKGLARKAVGEKIAGPLGMTVEEAAFCMRKLVDGSMGNAISKETMLRGHDPRNFVLFSFGGAGPTHCCGYAKASHIPRLITFPLSPVFSAFSGSLMDIRHIHELSRSLVVVPPGHHQPVLDPSDYNAVVKKLLREARRSGRAVGLKPEKMSFFLELDMKYTKQLHVKRTRSPRLYLRDQEDVTDLLKSFINEYRKIFGSAGIYPEGGVSIESFILHAVYPLERPILKKIKIHEALPPREAKKGSRPVFWEEEKGFQKTPVYDYGRLRAGNVIEGPAVVEAHDTTIVIPHGVRFSMDAHMNNIMELRH